MLFPAPTATVCPADQLRTPPDFSGPACETMELWQIDPQHDTLWIRMTVDLPGESVPDTPLGLYVFGKMASRVWINGVEAGSNGLPGLDVAAETAGRMDTVFALPRRHLYTGENEIVFLASAHHSVISVRNPVHAVLIADYNDPQGIILDGYLPALFTLGAFVVALVYFGVLYLSEGRRLPQLVLFLLTASMTAQLLVETSRGLIAYPYPYLDIRLALIMLLSSLFGLCTLLLVTVRFTEGRQRMLALGAGVATALAAIVLTPGFDGKASFSMLALVLAAFAVSLFAAFRHKPQAIAHAAALAGFAILILLGQGRFLDNFFYYAIAALILFLFVQQARAMARERQLRLREAETARKLELALDQARERTAPQMLVFKSPGKVERLSSHTIVRCSGAGDYVELFLSDGTTQLHNGSLNELEETLPAQFLRVHRSHIVNTAYVTALQRSATGTGDLEMSVGDPVPVSRRILPKVREALA